MVERASVRSLLERLYGTRFTPNENPVTTTVGTSATAIMRKNPSRVGFLVVNQSLNNVWIRPNFPASTVLGGRLDPNGGNASALWLYDGEVVSSEWFAIADGAGSSVYVLETVIDATGIKPAEAT